MADISGVERRLSFLHLSPKPPDQRPHTRVEDEAAVERKYTIGRELGRGSFGVVREVTSRVTREKLAVKIVNKDKPGTNSIMMLAREVEVLKILDHPHIIHLIEVLESAQKMYLVMELCTGGELTAILKQRGHFGEEEAKEVMKQLVEVLVYLHDYDIVHRDLKLENILLKSPVDSLTSDKLNIKVTDFGLAHMRTLSEVGNPIMDQRCGTPYYMAPEVILSRHEYTKMCDVWSLGVIMYYILCGKVPFQSEAGIKLEDCIINAEVTFREWEWTTVSEQSRTLIKGMLCKDTTSRMTALRVLSDAWFTGQAAYFLNAIDLMKDMTDDGSSGGSTKTLAPPRPHLEPVPETTTAHHDSTQHVHHRTKHHPTAAKSPHHHHSHGQQNRMLTEKRSRSSTLLSTTTQPHATSPTTTTTLSPNSCQHKNASTSSLSRSSPAGKQRSLSVGTQPASSVPHSRRTTSNQQQQTHTQSGGDQSEQQQNRRTSSTATSAAATPQHSKPRKHSNHSSKT